VGSIMRVLMGLIKDRHGTYYARKKVPKGLEEAVARMLGNGKQRQAWLKRSLATKIAHEANIRAKPVLMDFDRIIESVRQLAKEQPPRNSLSRVKIARMAEFHYAALLADDDEQRRDGTGSEPVFQSVARQLTEGGIDFETPFRIGKVPEFGLSEREVYKRTDDLPYALTSAEAALARGDIAFVVEDLEGLLSDFQIHLDRKSTGFRELGYAVLKAHVRALRAIERRNGGEPIDTPDVPTITATAPSSTDTLSVAFEGWKKHREPAGGTLAEYERAIRLFTELHGDLPVSEIRRRHAREFRQALQEMPRHRTGKLLKASLPELTEWGRAYSGAPRLSKGTINKLIGGVQAVVVWARDQGVIPDELQWADPFAKMRLEESQSDREPFSTAELKMLFCTPVFTASERPKGGQGEAAYWLPLLGLFTGARRGELAGLTAADVGPEETTGHPVIVLAENRRRNRSLKTPSSARTIPLHPELTRLGFMDFVEGIRRAHGDTAWLFPEIAPDRKGGASGWSKWFGRYIRAHGIKDKNNVFHSLRHNFKDALRAAKVPEDLNDALTGHSTRGSVGRSYGAKDIVNRYGMPTLIDAISRIKYAGFAP
jgi:integrase